MVGKSLHFGIYGGKGRCNALPTKQNVCGSTNSQHFRAFFCFPCFTQGLLIPVRRQLAPSAKSSSFLNELNSFLAPFVLTLRRWEIYRPSWVVNSFSFIIYLSLQLILSEIHSPSEQGCPAKRSWSINLSFLFLSSFPKQHLETEFAWEENCSSIAGSQTVQLISAFPFLFLLVCVCWGWN